jgi:hypothetical protein
MKDKVMNKYDYEYDDDVRANPEGCFEAVDHLVERVANDLVKQTEALADNVAKQVLCIQERHGLVRQLQALEPREKLSIKVLRERLTTLQAIDRLPFSKEPTDKLKSRLEVLTAIDKIDIVDDHNVPVPMKGLRARLRTLEKIVETAEAVAALPPSPEAIKAKAEADLLAARAAKALARATKLSSNVVPMVSKLTQATVEVDDHDCDYEDQRGISG